MKGIDVSAYNPIQDYEKVKKDGIDFAIVKIIRKDLNKDKLYDTHIAGFKKAGIPIYGVYNYSYATTPKKAITDADAIIKYLEDKKFFVWMDVEDQALQALSNEELCLVVNSFVKTIQSAGLNAGVYTGLSFYNNKFKKLVAEGEYGNIPFWIARYPNATKKYKVSDDPVETKKPNINAEMVAWQYSSKGSVSGIKGDVDLDLLYIDYIKNTKVDEAPKADVKMEEAKPKDEPEEKYAVVTNCFKLNVRSGPGMNHSSIGVVNAGCKVIVKDESNPYWIKVMIPDGNNSIGYCNKKYLSY